MARVRNIFQLALEAEKLTSEAEAEIEYVVYARIPDFGILHRALGSESQEQWEIKIMHSVGNAGAGRIRVRKTADKNGITYALTLKVRQNGKREDGLITPQVDISHAIACDQQTLEIMKNLSEGGMIKERYFFPTDHGLTWEVDVFLKPDGTRFDWVKMDLELKPGMKALRELPALPEGFVEAIVNQHGQRTDEEEQKIQMLYRTVFTTPNPNAKPLTDQSSDEVAATIPKTDLVEDGN